MMLEFTKKILKAVSFDAQLFQKELVKGLGRITEIEELKNFRVWCIEEFGKVFPKIIKITFQDNLKPIRIKNLE